MAGSSRRLKVSRKVAIALRVWISFLAVVAGLRRRPLPELVNGFGRQGRMPRGSVSPAHLGRIVFRLLRIRHRRARCLITSLVLYRMLRNQGYPAQLVIGLPESPVDHLAHAWIEIDHVDVGPPPGRGDHMELARYG
jgi:hypothetical protein